MLCLRDLAFGGKLIEMLTLNIALSAVLLLLLVVVVSWQWKCWRFVWQLSGWRGIAIQPFLWILLLFILNPKNVMNMMKGLRHNFRRPVPIIVGNKIFMYIDHPVCVESVMNAPECIDKTFMQDGFFANKGLLHAKGQNWKARRKQLNPAFSHNIVLNFFEAFNMVGNKLQAKIDQELQGNAVPYTAVYDLLGRATLEVSCRTTMDTSTNFTQTDAQGIVAAYKKLVEYSAKKIVSPWMQIDFVFRLLEPKNYESNKRMIKLVDDHLRGIVLNKYEEWKQKSREIDAVADMTGLELDQSAIQKHVFIEHLFHLTDSGELTLQDIMNESHSMTLVSFESISNAITSTLLCLAAHPDYQQQLRREIMEVFADGSTETITAEHLLQMKYLDMVVSESQRLLATIPINIRNANGEFRLRLPTSRNGSASVVVPQNTILILDIFGMQRDESTWGPMGQSFYPQHFAPDNEHIEGKTHRHPYAFAPFAKGLRSCIGQRYSSYLVKIMIVKLIAAFEWGTDTKLESLRYINGISLRLQKEEEITFQIKRSECETGIAVSGL